MRKPRYVTLAGWLFLALLALGIYVYIRGGGSPVERRAFLAGVGYTLALIGFFVMWAGGTARARSRDQGAASISRMIAEHPSFKELRKIEMGGANESPRAFVGASSVLSDLIHDALTKEGK